MTNYISLFHDSVGLIHSLMMSVMSIYIISGYIGLPLDTEVDGTSHSVLIYGLIASMLYFTVSTILTVFFEPINTKSIQLMIHHILAYIAIYAALHTNRYMPFNGMWYIMEISSVFLCLRLIVRNLGILKDKAVLFDLMFIVAYVLSRFTIPIYVYIQLIVNHNLNDPYYILIMVLTTISLILNMIWLVELYGMAKYKFFGGHSNKNKQK